MEKEHNMARRFGMVALLMILAASQTPIHAQDTALEAKNRQIVLEFYEKGLNQKDADSVVAYLGSRYTQHNPTAADGPDGFRKFIGFLKEKFPQSHGDVKHVFADGDFVVLHSYVVREPGTLGSAIVDIFKLENSKIVEHWDVIQAIPERSVSGNGMF